MFIRVFVGGGKCLSESLKKLGKSMEDLITINMKINFRKSSMSSDGLGDNYELGADIIITKHIRESLIWKFKCQLNPKFFNHD